MTDQMKLRQAAQALLKDIEQHPGVFDDSTESVCALRAALDASETDTPIFDLDTKLEMIAAMEKFGGSFVKGLAHCFVVADPVNTAKLYAAFPAIAKRYAEMEKVNP